MKHTLVFFAGIAVGHFLTVEPQATLGFIIVVAMSVAYGFFANSTWQARQSRNK